MTPMLISGGKAYPITTAQFAAARRFQPISTVAGMPVTTRAAPSIIPAPAPNET